MSSGIWNTEALGDNADLCVTLTETTGWWHYDHVVTLRTRYCQTASDYCMDSCWNICISPAHVQHGSWPDDHERLAGGLKFQIVHTRGNITVPKKCYCIPKSEDSQWLTPAVLFSFAASRCQPDLSQVFSAGLWVTGNTIIQISWISLAQLHHHQNCWTKKKSTEETKSPCTKQVKVTWATLGQSKHLHLMIKEPHCTTVLHISLHKKAPPRKYRQILIMFPTLNSSDVIRLVT